MRGSRKAPHGEFRRAGKISIAVAAGLALALLVVWLSIALRQPRPSVEVSFQSTPIEPTEGSADTIRFAVAPVWSPERTITAYQELASALSKRLHRPVRLVQRKTYNEVNELLRLGQVHLAIICTGAFIHARVDQRLALNVVAVPVHKEGAIYRSYIITRRDSGIRSFEQFAGRTFAFSDPLSLSGHYYPLSLVLQADRDPQTFFSKTTFTYSHNGSIRAVLDRIADGAAVDSLVYDYELRHNPRLGERLRVIHRSPPFGANPVVTPTSLDPELHDAITRELLTLHESDDGRTILDQLAIRRFQRPPPGLYDEVTAIVERVHRYLAERRP